MAKKLSQVDWLQARLESGRVENQNTMWIDGAIGNHTGVVARLRKRYQEMGKGYDYVKTYYRPTKNPRTKEETQVAEYYIPEVVKKLYLRIHGVKEE